jgi:hypothetical protein
MMIHVKYGTIEQAESIGPPAAILSKRICNERYR